MVSMRGTGGNPPRRLDQQRAYPPTGVQPGSLTNIFRGRLVIVKGKGPPGSGLYVYDLAGELIASIAATGGTGPLGGTVVPGLVSYSPAGETFVQMFGNELQFGSSNPASFVETSGLIFMIDATTGAARPQLQIQSPNVGVAADAMYVGLYGESHDGTQLPQLVIGAGALSAITSAAVDIQGTVAITTGSGTGGLLTVTNTAGSASKPAVQWNGLNSGDAILGVDVSGDTFNRFKIDTGGVHLWGPGNATQDTNLYRGAANTLQTDDSVALSNQSVSAGLAGAVLLSGASGTLQLANASGLIRNAAGAAPATVPGLTVNGTAFANLATATLPANDGNVVGGVYRLVAAGNGTWGTTEQLTLQIALGSTGIGSIQIAAAAFASGSSIRWNATATFVIASTGSGGTVVGHLDGSMNLTGTALNPGVAASNTLPFNCGQTTAAAFSTIAAQTLNIQAEWAGTVGTPSITSQYYYLERVA